jgi:hypothetical protein
MKVAALAVTVHAQWLATLAVRQRMLDGDGSHTAFTIEGDRLRKMLAELLDMPASSPADSAAKVRALLGAFDEHGALDDDWPGYVDNVRTRLEAIADELDAMR